MVDPDTDLLVDPNVELRVLLSNAAGIEYGLMVQYLYAAYAATEELTAASGPVIPGHDPLVLRRYQAPGAAAGDIATNPDDAHDTTCGTAGLPNSVMASSQVLAGRLVGFSVTTPVS